MEEGQHIASETPVEVAGEGGGRRMAPAFKRNLMIIGGVFGLAIIAIAAVFGMRSGNDKANAGGSVNVATNQSAVKKDDGEELSPTMRAAIQEKMIQEKKAAAERGQKVYVNDELVEKSVPITEAPPAQTQQGDIHANGVPTFTQEELDRIARRRAGLERQVGSLLSTMDLNRPTPARVSFSASPTAGVGGAAGAGAAGANGEAGGAGSATAAQAPGSAVRFNSPELVGQLEIVGAEISSPIDSYKTNFASARIVSGKLAGAYLVGTIQQQEDGLQIAFNTMRFNGKGYAISAIALDEKTSTNAMNANVDYRILQRWVFPVGAAALGAYANAQAQTGSSVTVSVNGQEVTRPAPTQEQARAAGVAAGVGILARQVDKEAQKPYRIQLEDRTFIGILFNAPVLENPVANNTQAVAAQGVQGAQAMRAPPMQNLNGQSGGIRILTN